jgi:predicted kinase
MSKLIVMVGLPGSGKSTLANELKAEHDAVILSSDDLRKEMFSDVNHQEDNSKVFDELHRRTKQCLENGQNVIYDATNINRKRRIHLINNEIKAKEKIVYYMNTPIGSCLYQDSLREKKVGYQVIDKMYKQLHIPTKLEGWDKVEFVHQCSILEQYHRDLVVSNLSIEDPDHEYLFSELGIVIPEFNEVYDVPQDSSYHSFSISRHIFYTYKHVLENYRGNRILEMKYAALFHDMGKGYCKSFYNYEGEEKRYASYIGHENVSSQIACYWLNQLGYNDDFVKYVVDLIQFHMMPMNEGERSINKLKSLLTEEQYGDLMFLHEADLQAK